MRVLFLVYESPMMPKHFPLGPGLLSAILKKEGHEVHGIFLHGELEEVFFESAVQSIIEWRPDLLCLSISSPSFKALGSIAARLRDQVFIPTLAGGPHPTLYPAETLAHHGIDAVCVGEGEELIIEVVRNMEAGDPFRNVPGLWKLAEDGSLLRNRLLPLEQNLDRFPWTDYDLFGNGFIGELSSDGWFRMMGSRGCPYSCTYCHTRLFRRTFAEGAGIPEGQLGYVRFRSNEDIIQEVLELHRRYPLKMVNFLDDLFCLDRNRTLEFCKLFSRSVPEAIGFSIQTHLQHMDREVVQTLRESRCLRVVVGVESGNPRILKMLKRNVRIGEMADKLSLLVEHCFPLGTWSLNILGNPSETLDEMLDTLRLNAMALVERVRFNVMSPYPGSEIYELSEKLGLFARDGDEQTFLDRRITKLKFPDPELAFLEKFQDIGHWYMNVLSPLDLRGVYAEKILEAQSIAPGRWNQQREAFLEWDLEQSRRLIRQGRIHYRFLSNPSLTAPTMGLLRGSLNESIL